MNKEINQQIRGLSQLIFNDHEYNRINLLLEYDLLNELRLYVSDKLEFLELMFSFDKENETLKSQIEKCNELENIVIDYYIENINAECQN